MSNWAIVPFVDCWEATKAAIGDLLVQEIEPEVKVLAISNGSTEETRRQLHRLVEESDGRVWPWHHNPPMPSLSATWNAALDFVWAVGGQHALVCNNDIRLNPLTYPMLLTALGGGEEESPLFVSAVGVTEEQYKEAWEDHGGPEHPSIERGGPDFSCYLISKECHQKYRFDEHFIPCYTEDCDYHRRLMLGGDGQRIFSVNVPYLHIDQGSGTLKSWDPERRARFEKQIELGSRAYYKRKWGGAVNQETFYTPFGEVDGHRQAFSGGMTTPELFEKEREKWQKS